jgi:hypothetical protein
MLKVTGASDDLIELEGDLNEEWDRFDSAGDYLAFSDGTVLFAKYDDDGIWRFTPYAVGTLYDHVVQGVVADDTFDVVRFKDGIKWCVCGKDYVHAGH